MFFLKAFALQRKLTATRHLLGDAHPVQVEIFVNPLLDRRNTVTATALLTTKIPQDSDSKHNHAPDHGNQHRVRLPKTQTLTIDLVLIVLFYSGSYFYRGKKSSNQRKIHCSP